MKINRRWLAIVPLAVAATIALVAASLGGANTKGARQASDVSGSITVWVDSSIAASSSATASSSVCFS